MNTKKPIFWILAAGGIVLISCIFCVGIALWYSGTPAYTAMRTQEAAGPVPKTSTPTRQAEAANTSTPAPTPTLAPTAVYAPEGKSYPASDPKLLKAIWDARDDMTDLQQKQFLDEQVGKRVQARGSILEVYEDGRVQLDTQGSGMLEIVLLRGLPKEFAAQLKKGAEILFDANIVAFSDFIGFTVELDEPVVWWVK